MTIGKKIKAIMLAAALPCMLCAAPAFADTNENLEGTEVQILFTHDMHSHLDPYKAEKDGSTVKMCIRDRPTHWQGLWKTMQL